MVSSNRLTIFTTIMDKFVTEIPERKGEPEIPERKGDPEQAQEPFDLQRVADLLQEIERIRDRRIKYLALFEILRYFLAFPNLAADYPEFAHSMRQHLNNIEAIINEMVMFEQLTFEEGAAGLQVVQKVREMTASLADFDHVEEEPVVHEEEPVAHEEQPAVDGYRSDSEEELRYGTW